MKLPLAFVRSGVFYPDYGAANGVGSGGFGRSRTASSSTYAYYLGFNPTDIGPSNDYYGNRYYGFPLRCLYPGSA